MDLAIKCKGITKFFYETNSGGESKGRFGKPVEMLLQELPPFVVS